MKVKLIFANTTLMVLYLFLLTDITRPKKKFAMNFLLCGENITSLMSIRKRWNYDLHNNTRGKISFYTW